VSVLGLEIKESLKYIKKIYGFKKTISAHKSGVETLPLHLEVQTNSLCHGTCLFCPYITTSKSLPQGKMEWELYKKIVDECTTFPTLELFTTILQNEPLMNKNIFKEIAYFKEKNKGRTPFTIVTNGYLLNDKMITGLKEAGVDYLAISINAFTKETYETQMPGFKFERIIENIESLLSKDLGKMRVWLRILQTSMNESEIPGAIVNWRKRGLRVEIIPHISNRGGAVEIAGLKPMQYIRRKKIWDALIARYSKCCIFPLRQMCILFNGDVILCCNDWQRLTVLGNVKEKSLREIWSSEESKRIKRLILERKYSDISACRKCTVPDTIASWR